MRWAGDRDPNESRPPDRRVDRGQLVLVAAAAVAVALAAMSLAFVQLGYDADVYASVDDRPPSEDARRMLVLAVHNASTPIAGAYDWTERSTALDAVNATLDPDLRRIETAGATKGVGYDVARNASAARSWSGANCPGGPDQQFGSCEAVGGIVIQERANETTVVAAAFDVRTTTERGVTDLTVVVRER